MVRIFVSDPHIDEESVEELGLIFDEIISYKADELYILGDYYNRKHPSPIEIYFGTKIARKLLDRFKKVYIMKGNHDEIDKKMASINYLQYMGIKILEDETIIKIEDMEVDKHLINRNILLGHFFTDKSNKAFNSFRYKVEDLSKYDYVFLGHQHNFQELSDKIYHLGACRFVTFGELPGKDKYIAILNDKLEFKALKSIIPMIEVFNSIALEGLDARTKVRFTIKSFDQFKSEINNFEKYKKKFKLFKVKLDFEEVKNPELSEKENAKTMKERVKDWIQSLKDEEVKGELKEVFK